MQRARAQAEEQAVDLLELRCLEDPGLGWPQSSLHATFIKDLPSAPAEVLAGMPKKARAEARKARRGLWSLPESERVPPWEWRHRGVGNLPGSLWYNVMYPACTLTQMSSTMTQEIYSGQIG